MAVLTTQEMLEIMSQELGDEFETMELDFITVDEYAQKLGFVFNESEERYEKVTEVLD
ncbi:hypothetical protein [Bacillus paralicheniformis]|uniref:hypothetical protein n=1 Tax=Bacillus paralicheniformis TaxID=1648923 RepID=UPI00189EC8B8|nr:hypothetical protein [Bacillus paralicheniformis]